MTNHWTDMDNSSMFLVFGANPAENHPASMAHINAARFGSKKARLVVVDPRLTRTARQCDPNRRNIDGDLEPDLYVRIRPGTNVAFTNGLINWILTNIHTYNAAVETKMLAWHNGTADGSLHTARPFLDDIGQSRKPDAGQWTAAYYSLAPAVTPLAGGYPKYCDSRFKVTSDGTDYQRDVLNAGGWTFSNFPVIAANVSDPDCVYQQLKLHVAPYTAAVVANICGCTADDVANVAKAMIDNSRFNSSDFLAGMATNGSTPQASGYRATAILYAMGQTQHTNGSQNIKDLAVIQTLMGNMGRAGGGIDALRGIHNVQGSTDFGLLFDSIPGYSGNPVVNDHYAHTLNSMYGVRVEDLGTNTGAVDFLKTPSLLGIQQRGFHNMTQEFFADGNAAPTDMEQLYDLWPKGNGVQHIQTFRYMAINDGDADEANRIKACVVWGQNPAVTEPNQSKVRVGLKNLDLLVVVDIFENETAAVDRKGTGVTYLIPACSHVEEAGSVTNSGRWLQWRERATPPKGNSKTDLELLLRFAYSLDKSAAFSHMTNVKYLDGGAVSPVGGVPTSGVWSKLATVINGPAYKVLFGDPYGWTPTDTRSFEAISGPVERWAPGEALPDPEYTGKGSEVVAEKVYIEICGPLYDGNSGGTMWIYSGTTDNNLAGYQPTLGDVQPAIGASWLTKIRAKNRNSTIKGAAVNGSNNYPRWGWAWLFNRRVFYNNGEIAGDVADVFVAPGTVSCMFTTTAAAIEDWSLNYRKYKNFKDRPSVAVGPHYLTLPVRTLMGRFPGHTEPTESPRPDLVTTWGHNTAAGDPLTLAGTNIGAVADFPLVLTSIRCVEHFQGGPITRNNSWNVEAEPVPWVEINAADARTYGIADGDWVNVKTARSDSQADQERISPNSKLPDGKHWARGFKARVGVGLESNQRVARGVVAIPWHWGDKGLSTGSRANDLCIDAFDANTTIPEYKACLCSIEKM